MNQDISPEWSAYVAVVDANIDDFVEELRTIDVVDLISFVRMERFPNIEDLVNSSTELFFKPDTLVFAWAATVDLRWEQRPVVTLGMEFRHPAVSLFFNLSIGAGERFIEILGIVFEKAAADPVRVLRRAFAEGRLPAGPRDPFTALPRSRPPTADPLP